jgi:phosphatidylethanolamine/phosphatidyl-N-methylethanolamine N-methyltransferase
MKSNFFSEFIRERKTVGAVLPSSKFLAAKMLKGIDFSKDLNIVELGPGTGIFTKEIIKKMSPESNLISIELNNSFYNQLTHRFKNNHGFTPVLGSADNISNIIKELNLVTVDIIISSLPLAVIPLRVKAGIFREVNKVLKKDGSYIQFQYSLNAKEILNKRFSSVNISFTPVNIPPAFVYHCLK